MEKVNQKSEDRLFNQGVSHKQSKVDKSSETILTWKQAQQVFEQTLLNGLYPDFPTTRKLAERLDVSHNKVAMKLKQYRIGNQRS